MIEIVRLAKVPITDGGPLYTLQFTPEDVVRLADATVEGVADIVQDFISAGVISIVHGGDRLITGGLNFDVYKPLRIWNAATGKLHEEFDAAPTSFTVPTPDATNPRVDRLYAVLTEEADGLTELRHVALNPAANDGPIGEVDANVVISVRNKVTLLYLQGTSGASPNLPDLPAGAVPLYQIIVPANAVTLNDNNFRDERYNFLTLEEVCAQIVLIWEIINKLKGSQPPFRADQINIDTAQLDEAVRPLWPTAQDAFNDLSRKIKGGGGDGGGGDDGDDNASARPLIIRLWDTGLLPSDFNHGLLGASGVLDENGNPCVEIPMHAQIDFSGTRRDITPQAFEDAALNARFKNKTVNGDDHTQTEVTALNLTNVVIEETDSSGDIVLQSQTAPKNFNRGISGARRIAPRSASVIDLFGFGGTASQLNASWYEYRVGDNSFTPRDMTGDLPTYGIIFACTLGNGDVLMASPGGSARLADGGRVKWFRLNTTTGVSTAIAGGPGDVPTTDTTSEYIQIMGDLVTPGASGIVSLIVHAEGIPSLSFVAQYEYHIDSNSFSALTPIGSAPSWARGVPKFQHMDACVYQQGELIVVDGFQGPAHTYVFNHANHSWRIIDISQPFPGQNPFSSGGGGYLWGLTICNVKGRIMLVSGSSTLWQLTPTGQSGSWKQIRVGAFEDSLGASRWGSYMTGVLSNGLPLGSGVLIGGAGSAYGPISVDLNFLNQIWKFVDGGITASTCLGSPGVTLGSGTTSATLRVGDSTPLPWPVDEYSVTVKGVYGQGAVSALVSFDGGVHKVAAPLGKKVAIQYSDPNPVRQLWLSLLGTANNKPCVISLTEVFSDATGTSTSELVLWWNPGVGTWYVFMDKATGHIRVESTFAESTSDRCWMQKVVRAGSSAPVVHDVKNKPFIHDIILIDKATADAGGIFNHMPVKPSFIHAQKINSGNAYVKMTTPVAVVNTNIVPTLGASEVCELELEG